MCERIADELQEIELGDKRLNNRSEPVIEALAANPEASINASCKGWAETQGAYRFFDNDAVTSERILQPHLQATDLCWLLITTLPIETIDDVLRIIDYYVARWAVEVYFRVLKTGCRVEEIQLETTARLKRCLAFYKIIAWRVLYLTYLNRTCPQLPCTVVFAECEWKSVWRVVTKKPLPKKPPTLSKFMQLLTHLGGYNNQGHRGVTRTATSVGRTPSHDRLRNRLARLRPG